MHPRAADGSITHRTSLALAVAANSPMPHALLYLRRLRVLTQICRHGPGLVLDNVLCHHGLCGDESWLRGIQDALVWARSNSDDREWLPALDNLADPTAWTALHSQWWNLRRLFRRAEKAPPSSQPNVS